MSILFDSSVPRQIIAYYRWIVNLLSWDIRG